MPILNYFDTVWAVDGDVTIIPDALDPSGFVSFDQGYTANYQSPSGTYPIERDKFNYLMNQVTLAIQTYQQFGTPPFITSTMNGGSPFSYSKFARVLSGGNVYTSLINSNVDTPPSSNWTTGNDVPAGGTGLTSLTAHNLLIGNGISSITLLPPSAASGIPLVSAGSSTDPVYSTAVIAGGGTGATTAAGARTNLGLGSAAVLDAATAGDVKTGTSSTTVPTPSVMYSHQGMVKAWVNFSLTGSIADSYNVSSVTDSSSSAKIINITSSMSNSSYGAAITQIQSSGTAYNPNQTITSLSPSALGIFNYDEITNVTGWTVNIYGQRS